MTLGKGEKMARYRKVYRDHEDPETGLRWYSADYVKEPTDVRDLPGAVMRVILAGYLGAFALWAAFVGVPSIIG